MAKVHEYWWDGSNGRDLHNGKIASFDEAKQKWNFICDSEPEESYLMAYEAVYKYVDKNASTSPNYTDIAKYYPICGEGLERVAI